MKLYETEFTPNGVSQSENILVIEIGHPAFAKGENLLPFENKFYGNVQIIENNSLFNYDPVENTTLQTEMVKPKKYDKFLYSFETRINDSNKFNHIAIISERKKRMHIKRLILLPIGICADVITFPVQAFIKITQDKINRPAFFEFPYYINKP